jgi:hypothetical protein
VVRSVDLLRQRLAPCVKGLVIKASTSQVLIPCQIRIGRIGLTVAAARDARPDYSPVTTKPGGRQHQRNPGNLQTSDER